MFAMCLSYASCIEIYGVQLALPYANSSSADSLILYFKILEKRAWNVTQCQALAQHLQGPGFNFHTEKKIDGKTASVWHIYRELFLLISQTAQLCMQHYIIPHTMKILEMFENSMRRQIIDMGSGMFMHHFISGLCTCAELGTERGTGTNTVNLED